MYKKEKIVKITDNDIIREGRGVLSRNDIVREEEGSKLPKN